VWVCVALGSTSGGRYWNGSKRLERGELFRDIAMRATISSLERWSGMLLLRDGVAELPGVGGKLGSFRAALSKTNIN
jgi:hypothetical protein